ncbi:MAG TPA: GGDEF domain-containing protein [Methylomirabilota bacterium]|nr:GGDEF domain-containing protein [Methylomirabilota bacterium]
MKDLRGGCRVYGFAQIRRVLSKVRWPLAILASAAFVLFASWLRHSIVSSEPIFYAYLQIVGCLLAFTYAANALVRFRGTHDRLSLMLAFGFILAGLIEMVSALGFYNVLAGGQQIQMHIPLAWTVGRTLLAVLFIAALVVERRVPHSREPSREMAIALVVVAVVAYLTSAAYLGSTAEPAIHPLAMIARPWDLFPATLFLIAALGYGRRLRASHSAFDWALCAAAWLNVACHIAASQSDHILDAPFTLAQVLKVSSYALVLCGALLDNVRLFEQVRHLAVTDSLTGLANYRSLLHSLESEIQRARRTGRSFSLLLLDMDDLKRVNDRYGHLVGSHALRRLATTMRANSRSMDTAARYGGDEFALILPEANAEVAAAVARRVCERLAHDGELPRLSVSVGTAVFPQDGETIEQLLNAADRGLYGMKNQSGGVATLSRIAACL